MFNLCDLRGKKNITAEALSKQSKNSVIYNTQEVYKTKSSANLRVLCGYKIP